MSKVSINLVTWNGEKYLPYLFQSLRAQTYTDWELLVIDNVSTDSTVAVLKKELVNLSVPCRLIVNAVNSGFAGGHNQAWRQSSGELVLLLNQDIYLEPDSLKLLVATMDSQPRAAAVTPRLMKWNFPEEFTDTIDSLGLKVFRSRRVVERGAGEEWNGTPRDPTLALPLKREEYIASPLFKEGSGGGLNSITEVFGVSGALPMFRRVSLQQVLFANGDLFDETYHSYKEDVDLAWRLRLVGFSSYLVPGAIAYHDRTASGLRDTGDRTAAANKHQQSFFVQYYSYKNHLATLYKNEHWQNFILDWPWILWYEVKKLAYFLLFNTSVLRGLGELWKGRERLMELRITNYELRKVSWREIRKWW